MRRKDISHNWELETRIELTNKSREKLEKVWERTRYLKQTNSVIQFDRYFISHLWGAGQGISHGRGPKANLSEQPPSVYSPVPELLLEGRAERTIEFSLFQAGKKFQDYQLTFSLSERIDTSPDFQRTVTFYLSRKLEQNVPGQYKTIDNIEISFSPIVSDSPHQIFPQIYPKWIYFSCPPRSPLVKQFQKRKKRGVGLSGETSITHCYGVNGVPPKYYRLES